MQELFSKAANAGLSPKEQRFYELRIDDSNDIWRPGYIVLEALATWSEEDGQFMWGEIETERLPTLEAAKILYNARRQALVEKGFILSDMDLF